MKKNGKGSTITTVVILIICVALAAAVISKMLSPKDEMQILRSDDSTTAVNVYVKEMQPEEFTRTVRLYGTVVNNSDDVSAVSLTSGYVTDLNVEKGDYIEVGDILGYVDPSTPGSQYKKSPITSKVSGKVSSVNVTIGQMISSGTSVATVSPDPDYVIEVDIPEKYIEQISVGSEAVLSSSIITGLDETAKISYVDKRINTNTRTYDVEFTADSSDLLEEGLVVTVDLITEELSDALTIPLDSVSTLQSGLYVYKVVDNVAVQTAVTTGSSNRDVYVVESGLEKGDVIVVEGTVTDGVAVNILQR